MIIDFVKINEEIVEHFKGGEGILHTRAFFDGHNKIMLDRLEPGATVGYHAHTENCEIIYVLSGALDFVDNDVKEHCPAGNLQYCQKGHSHSFANEGKEDAVFLAIVAEG